jgi:hypothetical protein
MLSIHEPDEAQVAALDIVEGGVTERMTSAEFRPTAK